MLGKCNSKTLVQFNRLSNVTATRSSLTRLGFSSNKIKCPFSSSFTTRNFAMMAWRSHGNDNRSLVDELKNNGLIKSRDVYEAMLKVDRGDFVDHNPYLDQPVPIGYGATISAPHMHAHACELLREKAKAGAKVLDVGSGSGILVAYLAEMVGPTGRVIGIEHIKELADQSRKNLEKSHKDKLESGQIEIVHGDGRQGYEIGGPYDAIHIGAAASEEVVPKLTSQLSKNGILLGPFEPSDDTKEADPYLGMFGHQEFRSYQRKEDGKISMNKYYDVRYVPLTSEEKQRGAAT
mmetsp:Transcript_13430/g.16698  ORF Transcript_13430/g.16698 Transcript_13430/m.16698 type:complete len:292 (-) Transcript_13430:272-1147(-)